MIFVEFAPKPSLPGKTPSGAKPSHCGITRVAPRKKITPPPFKSAKELLVVIFVDVANEGGRNLSVVYILSQVSRPTVARNLLPVRSAQTQEPIDARYAAGTVLPRRDFAGVIRFPRICGKTVSAS
ncbi:hypothetical protein Bbelb_171960 [Branchiostoma belcheri]|nr:hypothetical protein Bbelb_171960 [Branchiostoma belcheri]